MNKKLKKGLTTTMAAAMGLGVVIPAVPVIAAPATSRWDNTAAGWTYYQAGKRVSNGWVKDNGTWYYIDANGIMATGWRQVGGVWYYMEANGAMATGWKSIGGTWYYMNESGAMQKGWYKDATGTWYYSNPSGDMVANKWVGNYYLGASGAMATSQLVNGWYVDADGAWDGKAAWDVAAVEAAVAKAETSKSQTDIDAAKKLVDALPAVAEKDAFAKRLTAITAVVSVDSVTATAVDTLTIAGSGLAGLKTDAVTVAGNTVTAVTPAADGKSATVTLGSKLAPNADVVVNVTDAKGAKDYTVKYAFAVSSVSVNTATFDDERANQKVTFKVNGADADLDYLTLAGYSVNFVALDSNGNPANIFVGNKNTSSTGILLSNLASNLGKYTIEVQVIGNGTTTVSDKGTITVTNIDANASAINDVTFVNTIDGTFDSPYNDTLKTDSGEYIMNSTTLVAGEAAAIYDVNAKVDGVDTDLANTGFSAKSSNPAVLSVAKDANGIYVLKAESAGTATLTVTVGTVTKTYTFTVTNTERKLTKVTPAVSKVDLVVGNAADTKVKVSTFDQYGDPFKAATGDVTEVIPTGSTGAALVTTFDVVTSTDDSIGVSKIALPNGGETGTGTMYFKRASDGVVLGSLVVNVSAVDNVSTSSLKIQPSSVTSSDNALDYQKSTDNSVVYALAQYNSQNIFVGNADLKDYVITVADPSVVKITTTGVTTPAGTVTAVAGDKTFTLTAQNISTASASTSVIVKKADGTTVGQFTVTVANVPYKISAVQFKTVPTIDYAGKTLKASDVLTLTESNDDDVVDGITLNKTTQSKVRIAESVAAGYTDTINPIKVDDLYIDLDNNGKVSNGDVNLGEVTVSKTSDSTVSITPTAPNGGVVTALSNATASGDKGTLLVKILTKPGDATTSIAATSITISVK